MQISCDMEFAKEYKEYPEYPHFNYVMMSNYAYTQSGVLPFPGSLSEHPAHMLDIYEILMRLDQEREEDARRNAKKEKNGR